MLVYTPPTECDSYIIIYIYIFWNNLSWIIQTYQEYIHTVHVLNYILGVCDGEYMPLVLGPMHTPLTSSMIHKMVKYIWHLECPVKLVKLRVLTMQHTTCFWPRWVNNRLTFRFSQWDCYHKRSNWTWNPVESLGGVCMNPPSMCYQSSIMHEL